MIAYLLPFRQRGSFAHCFTLNAGHFLIGRSSECDFVINDKTVSRRHARFDATEDSISVADLGSLNGTFVDEKRIRTSTVIAAGQRLRLGSVSFRLSMTGPQDDELDSQLETEKSLDEGKGAAAVPALSEAQTRVLALLLRGLAEKKIAARLWVSPHTVHNHVKAIFHEYGVHSRSELLALFVDRTGAQTVRRVNPGIDRRLEGQQAKKPEDRT